MPPVDRGDAVLKLSHRPATLRDVPLLARLNRQLVEDEGARTRLTLDGLEARMRGWLQVEYAATIFELAGEPVAFALYRKSDGGTSCASSPRRPPTQSSSGAPGRRRIELATARAG